MRLLMNELAELADQDVPGQADCPQYCDHRTCDCHGVAVDTKGMLWTLDIWESILAGICRDFDRVQSGIHARVEAALEADEPDDDDDDNPDLIPLPVIVHVNGRGEV